MTIEFDITISEETNGRWRFFVSEKDPVIEQGKEAWCASGNRSSEETAKYAATEAAANRRDYLVWKRGREKIKKEPYTYTYSIPSERPTE